MCIFFTKVEKGVGVLLRPGGHLGNHGQGCLEVTWGSGMALGPKASSSLVDYEKGTFIRDGSAHEFINALHRSRDGTPG